MNPPQSAVRIPTRKLPTFCPLNPPCPLRPDNGHHAGLACPQHRPRERDLPLAAWVSSQPCQAGLLRLVGRAGIEPTPRRYPGGSEKTPDCCRSAAELPPQRQARHAAKYGTPDFPDEADQTSRWLANRGSALTNRWTLSTPVVRVRGSASRPLATSSCVYTASLSSSPAPSLSLSLDRRTPHQFRATGLAPCHVARQPTPTPLTRPWSRLGVPGTSRGTYPRTAPISVPDPPCCR